LKVGYLVLDPCGARAALRLLRSFPLQVRGDAALVRPLEQAGASVAASPWALAATSDVLFACAASPQALQEALLGADGLAGALRQESVVVDQGAGTPATSAELAAALAAKGLLWADAPLHAETPDPMPGHEAVLFGGTDEVFARIRPLLEATCASVLRCGGIGMGHATHLVTTALAACNRLITYECASVGFKQGLAPQDMAAVLNRSSGANSASQRVLPVIGGGDETTRVSFDEAVRGLRLTSQAADAFGSPMLIGNLARSLLETAANEMGGATTLDAGARLYEGMGAFRFTPG
jgi:3-hydroxyisobutyrate dehydrogenase